MLWRNKDVYKGMGRGRVANASWEWVPDCGGLQH